MQVIAASKTASKTASKAASKAALVPNELFGAVAVMHVKVDQCHTSDCRYLHLQPVKLQVKQQ